MQAIVIIRRDSMESELKTTNESQDDTQPPPYQTVIHKLENSNHSSSLPPSYTEIDDPSVVYINNYPGPPLADGVVQLSTTDHRSSYPESPEENSQSKKLRIYFIVCGVITIFFGLIAIGLQIGLLASHSIVYYYYGFWAGALIICIGSSTIMLNNRHQTYDLTKYLHSFICQAIFVAVVFCFGIIIIVTDTCDEKNSESDGNDDACKHSYRILNGFLVAVIALTFVQSVINTLFIGYLKRQASSHSDLIA